MQWQQGAVPRPCCPTWARPSSGERPNTARRAARLADTTRPTRPDFFAHNRGKRGMTIDAARGGPRARPQASEQMDVVVRNFRSGSSNVVGLGMRSSTEEPASSTPSIRRRARRRANAERRCSTRRAGRSGRIMSWNGMRKGGHRSGRDVHGRPDRAIWWPSRSRSAGGARPHGRGATRGRVVLGAQVALQSSRSRLLSSTNCLDRAGGAPARGGSSGIRSPMSTATSRWPGVREDRWGAFATSSASQTSRRPTLRQPEHRNEHRGALLDPSTLCSSSV